MTRVSGGVATVIFAKWPLAGRVKTRLVPPLTAEQAMQVHAAMLAAVVRRVLHAPVARRFLAVSPDEMCPAAARKWPQIDRVLAQGSGDLGKRIRHVTGRIFAESPGALLILGTDSPDLPNHILRSAAERVSTGECVMSPSRDGGYCLLGLPGPRPKLFENIDWGADRVAEQTRAAARKAGLSLIDLDPWQDVDTVDDLARLVKRLSHSNDPDLTQLHRALVSATLPALNIEKAVE